MPAHVVIGLVWQEGAGCYLKNRPTTPDANLPAIFPGMLPKAVPASEDAWLNLSHLEKATVFVIVKTKAMTVIESVLDLHKLRCQCRRSSYRL